MMATLKNYLSMLAMAAAVFALPACSDDDDPMPEPPGGEEFVKQGVLTEDETWTAENVYVLDGRVVVDAGVTLTIEPGTIIKAEDGTDASASALIVARGGKLNAQGTADKPVIFTSVNDQIEPGQTESTLGIEDSGQWGGLVLLGRAPISVAAASGEGYLEGIPADLDYGWYGGTVADDNSGTLNYVSIRFSGVAMDEDEEIQGLTLGGVGSGTTISNIEIFSNNDDGVEFFGGAVNVKNLVVYGQQDDGIDVDMAYSGTVENALVIQTAQSGSSLEIDGPEGNMEGSFTLKNVTVDAGGFNKLLCDLRDNAMGTLENIAITNIGAVGSTVNLSDAATENNYNDGKIIFTNWELELPEGKTAADLFTKIVGEDENENPIFELVSNNGAFVDAVAAGGSGADVSVFSWTFTKAQGAF